VCSHCGTAPEHPALCLLCGRLLCAKSSCCKESGRGELSHHTARCSPCGGAYLLLREAAVAVSSQGLTHSAGSCYADRQNELDVLLRRGRPLFLSQDRLENLRSMVAQQGAVTSFSQLKHAQQHSSNKHEPSRRLSVPYPSHLSLVFACPLVCLYALCSVSRARGHRYMYELSARNAF